MGLRGAKRFGSELYLSVSGTVHPLLWVAGIRSLQGTAIADDQCPEAGQACDCHRNALLDGGPGVDPAWARCAAGGCVKGEPYYRKYSDDETQAENTD